MRTSHVHSGHGTSPHVTLCYLDEPTNVHVVVTVCRAKPSVFRFASQTNFPVPEHSDLRCEHGHQYSSLLAWTCLRRLPLAVGVSSSSPASLRCKVLWWCWVQSTGFVTSLSSFQFFLVPSLCFLFCALPLCITSSLSSRLCLYLLEGLRSRCLNNFVFLLFFLIFFSFYFSFLFRFFGSLF